MLKVFISGPMRGIEDYNTPAFMEAERKLTEKGFAVFNPAWMKFNLDGWDHETILKIDFAALMECDVLYHLPGWENSNGAKEETERANACYIPVYDDIDEIPLEFEKYDYYELLERDKEGTLEPGMYMTTTCPQCDSTEHGGMVIKLEDGTLKKFSQNEGCGMNSQDTSDILSSIFGAMGEGIPLDEAMNENIIDAEVKELDNQDTNE